MKESGWADSNMVKVLKYGLTELNIKDIGLKAKLQAKANFHMLMATLMKENGKMIKLMDMEYTLTRRPVLNMKDIGKTICSMAQESRFIPMAISTKVCLRKANEMEKDLIT